jgi:outer membrane protein OmpA-like peptidoglycan-associated protein
MVSFINWPKSKFKGDDEMKKLVLMVLTVASLTALAMPSAAVVLTPPAEGVPSAYATVVKDKVVYDKSPTAFCSISFDKILKAYGGALKPEAVAGVPTSYAKVAGGQIVFNDTPVAYEPVAYHSIFTAYGFQLTPEEVKAKLGAVDYAKVIDGKIVFTKVCVAYSGEGFAEILAAYTLPMAAAVPVPAPTPPTVEKKKWTLSSDYLFDFDKAVVKAQYYPFLDGIAAELRNDPALKIKIEGHTCNMGSNKYNQGLSERRAKAVLVYLTKKNVDASRMTAIGYGETKPAYPNDTKEGRAKNRRVEIKQAQ